MNKKYIAPTIEIEYIEADDVILSSGYEIAALLFCAHLFSFFLVDRQLRIISYFAVYVKCRKVDHSGFPAAAEAFEKLRKDGSAPSHSS